MAEQLPCSSACPSNQYDEGLSLSDEELLESWYLYGCERCFNWWVERVWNSPVYKGIVRKVQKDWQQIDIFGLRLNVIEELWEKPRRIDFVKSYFRKMLWRAAYKEDKQSEKHQTTYAKENDEILANIQDVHVLVDDSPSSDLENCMQKLKPLDLKLTLARYYEEVALSEIAKELNKSMDALYQQLARIRKLLKKCLEG